MSFEFSRNTKEVGMYSDGAAVNVAAHKLVREELGEHYLLILCPVHKFELAIKDAFNVSEFNQNVQKDLNDIYYFFRKANLKWRLMKRQAQFMDLQLRRFKKDTGTRWVEHQAFATSVHLSNLPITAVFFNYQIASPYNTTMTATVSVI